MKIKGAKIALFPFPLLRRGNDLWAFGEAAPDLPKGIAAATAAQWVSFYWGGLTLGRLVSGFLAMKFNNQQMIRIGEITVLLGVVCLLLPLPDFVCLTGFVLVGGGLRADLSLHAPRNPCPFWQGGRPVYDGFSDGHMLYRLPRCCRRFSAG